jgi:hypothetical protein
MQNTPELAPIALNAIRVRTLTVLPEQVRACLGQLSEDQIWWRPNEGSNSIGNLVLHLSGAIMTFLCHRVGGFPYERKRDAEFSARGPLPKQQLLGIFNETIEKATETFNSLSGPRMSDPSTAPEYYSLLFEDLFGVVFHFATHAGQIIYITKMLQEGSVNNLWVTSHKAAKVWKT